MDDILFQIVKTSLAINCDLLSRKKVLACIYKHLYTELSIGR